jgi:hypothetical protein
MLLGSEREAYENMSRIYNIFRAIKNIVVRVKCFVDDFRQIRGEIEDQIQGLFQLVKDNNPSHDQSLDYIRALEAIGSLGLLQQ